MRSSKAVHTSANSLTVSSKLPFSFTSVGLIALSAACFGISIVMTKAALHSINPFVLLVIQSGASVAFLWAIVLIQGVRVSGKQNLLAAGMTGLLEPGLSYVFGILGLSLTSASNVALINTIEPIITIALAYFLLQESIRRSLLGWAGLACVGVGLIAFPDIAVSGQQSILGNALVFLSVCCAALYAIATRKLAETCHPLVLAALQQSFAFVFFLVVLLIATPVVNVVWSDTNFQTIVLAVASGILGYAIAFWLYLLALKHQNASITALYLTLIPLFGIIAAYIFLGERLSPIQGLGGFIILLVVFGITHISRSGDHTMLALDLKTTYRSATRADLPLLLELVQEFHEFEELPFDSSLDRTALEQIILDSSLGRIWLIYESSTLIGYVIVTFGYSLEYRGREACVDELYLRPAYRKRGIGSQTLQFVESACRSLNVNFLSLEVDRHNDSAQSVYRKAGFDDRGYCLMTKSIA